VRKELAQLNALRTAENRSNEQHSDEFALYSHQFQW
jgi:hypothetical protein